MRLIKEFKNFNPHPEDKFPQLDENPSDLEREEMEEPLEVISGFTDEEVEEMSDEELEDMYSALEKDIEKRNEGFIKTFESFRNPSNREEMIETLYNTSNFEKEELEEMTDEELEDLYNSLETEDWLDELDNEDSLNESESKNKPTNPKLWNQCKSWAKSKYDVWPSAYACGAAAKRYKSKGGKWKKKSKKK